MSIKENFLAGIFGMGNFIDSNRKKLSNNHESLNRKKLSNNHESLIINNLKMTENLNLKGINLVNSAGVCKPAEEWLAGKKHVFF